MSALAWFRNFGSWRANAWTARSMSILGDKAFGPRCDACGGYRTRLMLPAHRRVVEDILGRPPETMGGACHCTEAAKT